MLNNKVGEYMIAPPFELTICMGVSKKFSMVLNHSNMEVTLDFCLGR